MKISLGFYAPIDRNESILIFLRQTFQTTTDSNLNAKEQTYYYDKRTLSHFS